MRNAIILLLLTLSVNVMSQTKLVKTVIMQDEIYNQSSNEYDINSVSGKMITVALSIKEGKKDEILEVISIIINDNQFEALSQYLLIEDKDYGTHKTLYCINSLGESIFIKYNDTDFELYTRPIPMSDSYIWANKFKGVNLK